MNIWILQHDIAFSFELKAKLKTIFENEKPSFEVFHTVLSFWEEYEKLPKNRHKKPDFLILDIMLPDGNGVDLYLDLKKRNETASVLFCSAANYTQFEEFFEKRGGEIPAFILKSQVETGLEKQVRAFFPLKEKPQSNLSFFQKKDSDQLDQALKDIEKEYYQNTVGTFKKEVFENIQNLAEKLGNKYTADLAKKVISFLAKKNSLKLKALVKELISSGQTRTNTD